MKFLNGLPLLVGVCLVFGAILPVAADELSAEELRQLRVQQQQTIQRLEENQARQAREIEELQRQITSGEAEQPSATSSERVTQEDPEVKVPYEVTNTPPGMAISVGGHINRTINIVDDGAETKAYFVDSSNYPTLLYLKGYKQVGETLTIGGIIEYAVQQNAATSVSQDNQDAGLDITSRFFELTADSTRFGKLWFGRGFMSSFLAVEVDKSETWRYNLISPGNSFGGMKFVDARDNSLSDIQVNLIFLDVEAFSFRDRIRYDSPSLYGLQLSGSYGAGDSGDVTLRWNAQLGDFSIFAGGSTQKNSLVGRIDERIDGGIGVYHAPTGLNLSAAGFRQDFTREFYEQFNRSDGTSEGWIARAGIRKNWFGVGESRFAIDFSRASDVLYSTDQADSIGGFFGQMIDAWNTELYTGYRLYDYDTGPKSDGLKLQNIHGVAIGARIGFDATLSRTPSPED